MAECLLYYTLNSNISKKDLPEGKKIELIKKISKLNQEQIEAFFLLICEHQKIENGIDYKSIPYGGIKQKSGVQFDLQSFPIQLRWILYKFIDIVIKSDN